MRKPFHDGRARLERARVLWGGRSVAPAVLVREKWLAVSR